MPDRRERPTRPDGEREAEGKDEKKRRDWADSHSISPWRKPLQDATGPAPASNVTVDCGWGRVIFAHTFPDDEVLADTLRAEEEGRRDIAFYLRDAHVLIARSPEEFFLDPSHTFRLWFDAYEPSERRPPDQIEIRKVRSRREADGVHALYRFRRMVPPDGDDVWRLRDDRRLIWLVAVDRESARVLGCVLGINHHAAFRDPERGSSLWSLAVDPQAPHPGIGESLVRALIEHFRDRECAYLDLSVMHDNREAIALYEKLGFERVPVFAVKRKNPINEPLYVAPPPEEQLNPYARIIADEARRRGIRVEVLDAEAAFMRLSFGGRVLTCRESLSELTSAVAMSRCDDKRVTWRALREAGLRMPDQRIGGPREDDEAFMTKHGGIVVKPRRGEQGHGVTVDVRTSDELERAIRKARAGGQDALLEEFCPGEDLRIIVIDGKVVAAAVRRPAQVIGTGRHSVRQLVRKQSRRREAATGGESRIPLDAETRRCVEQMGYTLEDVPAEGEELKVRKTANLHTGGTIHDVTAELHPKLGDAAVRAARALEIPVVGLDLMVEAAHRPGYVFVEANERPGLANHEPQPTAERFIDFLFPQTRAEANRGA